MLVLYLQTTNFHSSEDCDINIHCCENLNLKFCIQFFCSNVINNFLLNVYLQSSYSRHTITFRHYLQSKEECLMWISCHQSVTQYQHLNHWKDLFFIQYGRLLLKLLTNSDFQLHLSMTKTTLLKATNGLFHVYHKLLIKFYKQTASLMNCKEHHWDLMYQT